MASARQRTAGPGDAARRTELNREIHVITLSDMVASGSISSAGADVLRAVGSAGRSFLVYALPRNAGKSTLTEAILAEAPSDLPRTDFFGTEEERAALSAAPGRGYLVVGEIGHRGRPGYLADEEVPRVFQLVTNGYALASSLHADTVEGVFEVLARNGVDADAAAAVKCLAKVRALGDPNEPSTRRVVEQIDEVTGVVDGRPTSTRLYEWDGQSNAVPSS